MMYLNNILLRSLISTNKNDNSSNWWCAGFIGSSLLRQLAPFNERLVCVDKFSYASKKDNVPEDVELYKVDLADEEAVRYLFEQETITDIFHLT